jgi:hypothetical protein
MLNYLSIISSRSEIIFCFSDVSICTVFHKISRENSDSGEMLSKGNANQNHTKISPHLC